VLTGEAFVDGNLDTISMDKKVFRLNQFPGDLPSLPLSIWKDLRRNC
jgi:hypothetical protein